MEAALSAPARLPRAAQVADAQVKRALWALLLLGLAVQMAWPLATLPLHISNNNNEGWNAYWSMRALAHQPLYTDRASPITNNYPPLSFYLIGYAGRAVGDLIVGGRLVCLASLLACVGMIRATIARVGGDARWANAAAATFLLLIATTAWRYVAADDPQWLAEALMLGGLLLLLGRDLAPPSSGRIVAACLVMLVGGLLKHSQLAAPVAVTLWLGLTHRRGLLVWLATAVIAGGAALALLAWQFGPPMFDQVLHHLRNFQPLFLRTSASVIAPLLPAIVLSVLLFRASRRAEPDPRLTLLFLFAGLALVLGIAERAGQGVAQNAHFDAMIGFSILAGVALARGSGPLASPRARLVGWGFMLLPLIGMMPIRAVTLHRQLTNFAQTRADWRRAIAFIAAQPGPAGCERLALCYWANKPYVVDFFNYGQKLRIIGDPAGLDRQIAGRRFGALVLHKDKRYWEGRARLPVSYYRAIDAGYRTVQVLPDKLYVLAPRIG